MKQLEHIARQHLIAAGKRIPGIWSAMEKAHAAQSFPSYMYLNDHAAAIGFGEAIAKLSDECRDFVLQKVNGMDDNAIIKCLMPFVTLACWRMTQGIYRFDTTVYESLLSTKLDGELPVDVLLRLPEWCVYLETPGLFVILPNEIKMPVHGVWARINQEASGTDTLVFAFDIDECVNLPHQCLPLRGSLSSSIDELLQNNHKEIDPLAKSSISNLLAPVINLLLYLCADGADIDGKRGQPANPVPRKVRRAGVKLFAADGVATWNVGVRMGAALRQAYLAAESNGGTHDGPRPHMRRAHWHGFRSGPRLRADGSSIPSELRKFELRWLPPISVNLVAASDLPAVIHPTS